MTEKNEKKPVYRIIRKAGPPRAKYASRPSVEYTGRGYELIYDAWAGRFFRSNFQDVKDGISELMRLFDGDNDSDGTPVNYNTLYSLWGLSTFTDKGQTDGWSPECTPCLKFDIYQLDRDSDIGSMFDEPVIAVSPAAECWPYSDYWEY